MDQGFINILYQLVREQSSAALTDARKCKAFLADYTKNEYKRECRLILLAVEAGMAKVIEGAGELEPCKKAFIKDLEENHDLKPETAADIINTLALVLRGDMTETVSATVAPNAQQTGGSESVAELFEKAYTADKTGDTEEAFRYFGKIAELMGITPPDLPAFIEAFFKKGRELHNAKKIEEAIIYYKGAAFFGHKDAIYRLASLGGNAKGETAWI